MHLWSLLIQNININIYFALFTTKRSYKQNNMTFLPKDAFPPSKPNHTGSILECTSKKIAKKIRGRTQQCFNFFFLPSSYAKLEFHNSPDVRSPQQIINITSYHPARRRYSHKSHFHVKNINGSYKF